MTPAGLRVLVVDDEAPARADLAWLLGREPSVADVAVAADATEALRMLQRDGTDVVFLDVRMPGLHGLDLARVLGRFAAPPEVVFVTAYEEHAVEAFELRACDYLLKPVRAERLREALARLRPRGTAGPGLAAAGAPPAAPGGPAAPEAPGPAPAGPGASAAGVTGARWAAAGFFRIHRSYLVALGAVTELRAATGAGCVVVVDGRDLPVSRRHTRELKDALVRSRTGGGRNR